MKKQTLFFKIPLTILGFFFAVAPTYAALDPADCASVTQIPVAECEALVDIYNNNNGDTNWPSSGYVWGNSPNSTNWVDFSAIGDWRGIVVANSRIVSLGIINVQLTTLPESLGNLSELKNLYLNSNNLVTLPASISNLTQLERLEISDNNLNQLPSNIANLTQLDILVIRNNDFTTLPESFGNLSNLSRLYMKNNTNLTTLPESFGNLSNLSTLELEYTGLIALPENFGSLTSLSGTLNLHYNELATLPASIGNLSNITTLQLHYNNLTSLPDSIGNLSVTTLNLAGNQLTTVPDAIGNMPNLLHLSLNNNQISTLPDSISNLTTVTTIYLNINQLTALPDTMEDMTSLAYLDVSENSLTALPSTLNNMPALETLRVNNNALTSIPQGIEDMTNLNHIVLSNNNISGPVPSWIYTKSVELSNNLLECGLPSVSLLATPFAEMHNYNYSLNVSGNNIQSLTNDQIADFGALLLGSNFSSSNGRYSGVDFSAGFKMLNINISNQTNPQCNYYGVESLPIDVVIQDATTKLNVSNELLGAGEDLEFYKEFEGVKRMIVGAQFDLSTGASNFGTTVIDADPDLAKAVVHFTGVTQKEATHDLWVIKGGAEELLICPDATTLVEVEVGCSNGVIFDAFPSTKTVGGASVTATIEEEDDGTGSLIEYFVAAGVIGTGGAGIDGCGQIAGAAAGDTQACQQITGGGLSISAPNSVSFSSMDISSTDVNSVATFTAPVVIQDLRDSLVGFTGSVTMTNFVAGGNTIPYTNLQLKTNAVSSIVNSILTGVTAPNQVNATFTGVGGTSDAMTIMIGSAIQRSPGQWAVTPELDLLINAFQPSGSYTSTMVFTAV